LTLNFRAESITWPSQLALLNAGFAFVEEVDRLYNDLTHLQKRTCVNRARPYTSTITSHEEVFIDYRASADWGHQRERWNQTLNAAGNCHVFNQQKE
jgi:hypothetical protein